ncbi:hypothetical protein AAFF_G00427570 [Aldrovandia affinis]|uniref:Uncharacterized protein n=1 Tax=Aldrovandia affinis TaxID=143900 RepID=A0AAD7WIT6_9TELE|nr:hypothetical protein AAFF_G00427570 [Aldrovandia affinis]
MAAAQGRRKHGACFLRIRENCPFRKLRKNKCYDLENVPAKKSGERWAHFNDHPALAVPQADSGISVIDQPAVFLNELQEQAMDTDNVRSPASQARPSDVPAAASAPARGPSVPIPQHQQNPAAFNCDTSMELDSGVDPETGERAQG